LAGGEVDIFVLVEVLTEALGRDVIMPGQNIEVDGAAVCGSAEKIAVYIDILEVEVTTRTPSQAGSFLVASPRSVQCGGPDAMGA
jgi:hypothetical protein